MRRGATPLHTFTLPFDSESIKKLRIIYEQKELELIKSDYTIDGNKVTVRLTQDESLKFKCNELARVQIKALMQDNSVNISDIKTFMVEECLDNEVIE